VHGSWVVLHDPAGPAEEARVLVLLGADTSAPGRARLADDIADRLPTVLDRLRTILEEWGRRDRPAGGGPAPPSSPGSSGGAAQAPPPSFGPSHLAGAHRPTADTGSGAQFGPRSDPGPSYGPTYDAGTDPPQWGRRVTDPAGGTTSPLPAGDDADDPDVPQSWRPTADPGSGPPTYGPRG
jgi:hypothetical protein